ncbi:MAG: hypothetical protein JNL02_16465 [Saprospiraceae bacterium]|nr:hypothetical protein [Saprospiraceae bacterium]
MHIVKFFSAFATLTVLLTALAQCQYRPKHDIHLVYWAQLDANEVWLVYYEPGPKKVAELITPDMTTYDPSKQGMSGQAGYFVNKTLPLVALHEEAQEPNVSPYYIFEYVQQKLTLGGQPIYYEKPLVSKAFAVDVNHLGAGWTLLRESLFIFDKSGSPATRFEQVYRGPDKQIYLYRPGEPYKQLLKDAIKEGYIAYQLAEFE